MRKVQVYRVSAIAPSGARKLVAENLNGTRAAILAREIKDRGFQSKVSDAGMRAFTPRKGF